MSEMWIYKQTKQKMNYKISYEVKVKNPKDIDTHSLTKFSKEIKVSDPDKMKFRGKIVYGDKDKNMWMSSKFW